MIEILPGVLAMPNSSLDNKKQVVVAVHPYYQLREYGLGGDLHKSGGQERKESASLSVYSADLEDFLKSYTGPILIMEEEHQLKQTQAEVAKAGRDHDTFFFITELACGKPKYVSWRTWLKTARAFAQPLQLIGGYYCEWEGEPDGCLGDVIKVLQRAKVPHSVLEELTF